MSNTSDFIIENGVLKKYVGPGASKVIDTKTVDNVVIPDGVIKISKYAFGGCYSKSFTFPDSVTTIEESAFSGCRKLTTLTLPKNLVSIEKDAFFGCERLQSINILGHNTEIAKDAFVWCEKIQTFFAPFVSVETVKKLELMVPTALAFLANSEAYTDAAIAEAHREYIIRQKKKVLNALLEADLAQGLETYMRLAKITEKNIDKELLLPAQNIKAKKCVKQLTVYKKSNPKVQNEHCEKKISPTKDWSVKTLSSDTIMITGYKGADINISIPSELQGKKVVQIAKGAFSPVHSRTNAAILNRIATVVIPETVTTISERAFLNCKALTSIVIPNGVTEIGQSAFFGCESLCEITLPTGIKSIEPSTFHGCSSLPSLTIPAGICSIGMFAFCGCSISSITIPDSVTTLGNYAFAQCSNLEYVQLHKAIIDIEDSVFDGCNNVQQITAPGVPINAFKESNLLLPAAMGYLLHNEVYNDPAINESYQTYIKSQKKKILPVVLSNDWVNCLEIIMQCAKVNKDTFDVEFIQPSQALGSQQCVAFLLDWKNRNISEKSSLDAVERALKKDPFSVGEMKKIWKYNKLPDGSIEITGYKGAETELVLPERIGKNPVTTIGESAFIGNKELRTVEIPDSVTTIGESAFFGCENLQTLIISGKLISVGKSAFRHCPKITPQDGFVIIGNILFSYCGNDADVDIPEGTLRIEEGAFSGKTLQSITIPKSVTNIDAYAFADCKNLKKVALQNPSVVIDNTAFWGCKNLADQNGFVVVGNQLFEYFGTDQDLMIPDVIGTIKSFLFSNCSHLQTVTIPDSVTLIENWAFDGCRNLRDVFMPADVTKIEMLAFSNCDNLTIHAPAGSYAETYAKENNIPFVAE